MTAVLALSSSWAIGWSVVFHLATDDHHGHRGALGLEVALHGHAHAEGTPAHGHPFVGMGAPPIPERPFPLVGAMIGDTAEVVITEDSNHRLLSPARATHDPPPRPEAVSILRI